MERTPEQIAADYKEFRGKCKVLCEQELAKDPTLTLVRGHVFIGLWPSDPYQPHWWLKRADGTIVDPSWRQFPCQPAPELYEEFDGNVSCDNCGEVVPEDKASFDSNYAFCSYKCHGQFIGML